MIELRGKISINLEMDTDKCWSLESGHVPWEVSDIADAMTQKLKFWTKYALDTLDRQADTPIYLKG